MQISQLGPYELGDTIGKGGMGSVYRATDSNTGAEVAIKALNPQLALSEGFRERFEAEIESLKKLHHEGIVRLYGYGEQDGVLFYSMELVDGTSLEEELRAGRRFDWREVADIAIQLCHALKHAHDHGVVHRDIKPANILIDGENQVKLADFGIARLFGNTQLTTAGGVLGTADYMSPEQAEGRPVTDRCDQYSLGGVMYALLSGRTPFRSKSLPEMLQLQRYAEPEPVRRYARDTPAQMEKAISQMLSKEPQERFPNVKVLAWHLEAMVRALSRPAHDDFAVQEEGEGETSSHLRLSNQSDQLLSTTMSAGASDLLPDSNESAPNGRSEAMSDDQSGGAQSRDLQSDASHPDSNVPSDALTMNAEDEVNAEDVPKASPGPEPTSRFTLVDVAGDHDTQQSWQGLLAQVLGGAVLLAVLAGTALYSFRPPSADVLYATIIAGSTSGETNGLREIEEEIEQFLARFPEDSRVPEVESVGSQVLQATLERRLENQARFVQGPYKELQRPYGELLPIERHYLRAVRFAEYDLQRALEVLESLLVLYGQSDIDPSGDEGAQRRIACLNVASKKLEELRATMAELATQQMPQLQERLESADRLTEAEPQEAAKLYQAIVDLYGNQDWAAEVVDQAREKLDTLKK